MLQKTRLLSIDPGLREIGMAFFEGTDLVDFGVRSLRRPKNADMRIFLFAEAVVALIAETEPDVVVIAGLSDAKIERNPDLLATSGKVRELSTKAGIEVREVLPHMVKRILAGNESATNRVVSGIVYSSYPEIRAYLGSKYSRNTRYYQNLLDAAAAGLAFIRRNSRQNG